MNKKQRPKTNKIFDETFIGFLSIFLFLMLFVFLSPSMVKSYYEKLLNENEAHNIGNALSGLVGPFVAVVAALITFLAFWVQYKWNTIQRNDLAIERFEHNYFELLRIHQGIVENLRNEEEKVDGCESEIDIGREVFDGLYDRIEIETNKNYYDGIRKFAESVNFSDTRSLEKAKKNYDDQALIKTVDNYFSFTERVLCYVDESFLSEEDKKYYASFLRDTFNVDELLVMFYHCLLSQYTGEMKRYIEKYGLFKNLRITDLARKNDIELYAKSAYH